MDYRAFKIEKPPKLTRLRSVSDLNTIEFVDGVAEVEVPVELLEHIPVKNFERENSPRLQRVVQAIRRDGYSTLDPIICRVGPLGNWVVIDGGHRFTAARQVAQEFFANLFGQRVRDVTFILFQTPMSYAKLRPRPDIPDEGPDRRVHDMPSERARKRREQHLQKKKRKKKN